MKSDNKNDAQFKQSQLLINSSMFYVFIAAVGLMVAHYRHGNLGTVFLPYSEDFLTWQVLALGGLTAGVIICKNYLFEDFFPSYRMLFEIMAQLMGRLSLWASLFLAVIAAVAEEIMFRAAIQPSAGLVLTAGLFALLHIGPANRLGAWALIAFLSGLIFAWTFEVTGSIWPSMIGHTAVNVWSMFRFKAAYKKAKKEEERRKEIKQSFSRGIE